MKTILVINDNEGVRRFISEFLRWRSFDVIEAKDNMERFALAIAQKPDLIPSSIENALTQWL